MIFIATSKNVVRDTSVEFVSTPENTKRRIRSKLICGFDQTKPHIFGGEEGIRTLVGLLPNGFQDFLTNPTLTQNNRKYQTVENAENPDVSRVFGVLSFPKSETVDGARISASKTISKDFLEKVLDKSAPIYPVASHILSAKFVATD